MVMLKVTLPRHLWLTKSQFDEKGYIRKATVVMDPALAQWFELQLGYVPQFEPVLSATIRLPNQELITALKLAWF